jgi:hypothetical protein
LTLAQARRHFHLDLNDKLDKADAVAKLARTRGQRKKVAKQLKQIWRTARRFESQGEFDKVLKRIYRLAGFAKVRFLRRRAMPDVIANPGLTDRICDYMRCSGTIAEYLTWAMNLMGTAEQIYPDVNVAIVESLLRLEPSGGEAAKIRTLATSFLLGKSNVAGATECKGLAPLLILRFGDKRSLRLLKRCFTDARVADSPQILRAGALVYSSYGSIEFAAVRRASSRLLNNHLADVVRLVERIGKYPDVPARYKARVDLRYDAVAGIKFVDMRALLTVRLLHLANAKRVAKWVADWKAKSLLENISNYDRQLIARLL